MFHFCSQSSCHALISSSFSVPLSIWSTREVPLLPPPSNSSLISSLRDLRSPPVPTPLFPAGRGQPPGVQRPDELLPHLVMLLQPVFFASHTCLPVSLTPVVNAILKTHLLQSQACREGLSSMANVPAGSRPQFAGSLENWIWSFPPQSQPELSSPKKRGKWSSTFLVANTRTQIQLLNLYLEWDQSYSLYHLLKFLFGHYNSHLFQY